MAVYGLFVRPLQENGPNSLFLCTVAEMAIKRSVFYRLILMVDVNRWSVTI